MTSSELQAQLDNLNKVIFETAIKENAGKYITNSDINLTGDNTITEKLENAKIMDKIVSTNAMIDFHMNRGIIVKVKAVKSKRLNRLYNL